MMCRLLGVLVLGLAGMGAVAVAQDDAASRCETVESWFNMAVAARAEGAAEGKVRRMMRREMNDKAAADELTGHVFALPEALLTPEVGAAARAQCEAL